MNTDFNNALGRFKLERYPIQAHQSLQAFDAADEYLINTVAEASISSTNPSILVLNDNFGALACSLIKVGTVTCYSDSYLAQLALEQNLINQRVDISSVKFIPCTQALDQYYDIVLIRIPKTLALLEQQLINLQSYVTDKTLIIAGAMIKHLPRAAGELLEKYIGTVQASLAVKKARLLKVTALNKPIMQSPYPSYYTLEEPALTLANHANVFCREGLDIGTRAFLPHLPRSLGESKVADLGCGNGILGIICALNNPQAQLTLVDESYMAIASAKENWQRTLGDRLANIYAGDGLANQPRNSLDVVLCNPPFHQQQVIGDLLAWRMFKQSHNCLNKGGELWLVSNRHLGYPVKLKRLFSRVEQIAQTTKFVILKAVK